MYAEAVCDVGRKLNIPVVDLWTAFMAKTNFKADAWKLGDAIPGSLDTPQDDGLVELMYDGRLWVYPIHVYRLPADDASRASL